MKGKEMIYKKMALILSEIGAVDKSQTNQQQKYKFRGIDQFTNALHPLLAKHEVFLCPRCIKFETENKDVVRSNGNKGVDRSTSILMEYDFIASDGSKATIGPIPAEGLDSGDKATNKALSAALKYALIQTFAVPTEDMEESDRETIERGRPIVSPISTDNKSFNDFANIANDNKTVTDKQVGRLFTIVKACGWTNEELRHFIQENYDKVSTRTLTMSEYDELINFIQESATQTKKGEK